jgi:hypothetical protein
MILYVVIGAIVPGTSCGYILPVGDRLRSFNLKPAGLESLVSSRLLEPSYPSQVEDWAFKVHNRTTLKLFIIYILLSYSSPPQVFISDEIKFASFPT